MTLLNRIRILPKAAVLALSAALTFSATDARAEYVGAGYLQADWGCQDSGWPTGTEMFRARFTPAELGGRMSVLVLDLAVGGTMVYRVRGPLDWSRRWHRANGVSVWGDLYRGAQSPRLRLMYLMAGTTGNASFPEHNDVRLGVRIRHFNGDRGCVVTAHMMLRNVEATGMTY